MKKTVYLIGGLMVNDNFGDVIQAKVWIDKYSRHKDLHKVLICYKEGIPRITELFPNIRIESYERVMKKLKERTGIKNCFFHFYGGGYLNSYWGKPFAELLGNLAKNKVSMIATGIQLDKNFYEIYRKEVGETPEFFDWISFRDSHSRGLMTQGDGHICDDVFLHLRRSRSRDSIFRYLNLFPNKAFIQLSLNSYMYENIKEVDLIDSFRQVIERLAGKNQIDIYSSFDKDKDKVAEAEYLYKQLNTDTKVRFLSVKSFSQWLMRLRGYRVAIVNSYHTYIVARRRMKCPVYFVAISKFYKQKAMALEEYGLLDKRHTINSLKDLGRVGTEQEKLDGSYEDSFENMFERANQIEKHVDKLIRKFIRNLSSK
ncbi:hypothetical protein GF389_03940 [Candidatus Dojkabacteria bacterium]|nr:hypothetical protein [Candidatus Dojkabacteria bacterium]